MMTLKEELQYVATQVAMQNANNESLEQARRVDNAKKVAVHIGPALVTAFKGQASQGNLSYTLDLDDLSEGVQMAINRVCHTSQLDRVTLFGELFIMFPSLIVFVRGDKRLEFSWS